MNQISKVFQVLACIEDRNKLINKWQENLKSLGYDEDDYVLINWNKFDSWTAGGLMEEYGIKGKDRIKEAYDDMYKKGFYVRRIIDVVEKDGAFEGVGVREF